MSSQKRKVADCRLYPSEKNCTLTISGTEDEEQRRREYGGQANHKTALTVHDASVLNSALSRLAVVL